MALFLLWQPAFAGPVPGPGYPNRRRARHVHVGPPPRPSANTGAEIPAVGKYADRLNPHVDGLPKEVQRRQIDRYKRFFELLLKHRDRIERVTFWGMHDGESWKNNFPVRGRTNYPLLFDRKLNRKPVHEAVAALGRR